jgi:hypothetical protein
MESRSVFARNKVRLCVGHYPNNSFDYPGRMSGSNVRLLIEISDTACNNIQKSSILDSVVGRICPHPVRFRQVWNCHYGKGQALFVWKPVPPSQDFVALGMVATLTDEPPSVEDVHCVPKRWTLPARIKPRLVWSNTGMGGKPGSVWLVNSLNVLVVVQGHNAPDVSNGESFYDLAYLRFFCTPEDYKAGLKLGSSPSTGAAK